jgi:hypothetical protein
MNVEVNSNPGNLLALESRKRSKMKVLWRINPVIGVCVEREKR